MCQSENKQVHVIWTFFVVYIFIMHGTTNVKIVTGFVQIYEAEMRLWQRHDRDYKNKNGRNLGPLRIMSAPYKNANTTWKVKYSLRLLSGIIYNFEQRKKSDANLDSMHQPIVDVFLPSFTTQTKERNLVSVFTEF
jgi:hypothetical protein